MRIPDVLIIGAGAAGLFCAIEAAKRGRRVVVLDHANKAGKKILMSGGGRCNFTNLNVTPEQFISHNPHFCKSALSRFTPHDFISLVKKHKIAFHEKTLGQLFCDNKSKDILAMLLNECKQHNVDILLNTSIKKIEKKNHGPFTIKTNTASWQCDSLVIATGGLSIPTMGASPLGYQIATQFGIHVWPTRAGLVPITLHKHDLDKIAPLSGIGFDSTVTTNGQRFRENTLLTHRGLSGPAILQISSYWLPGDKIQINLLPENNLFNHLQTAKQSHPKETVKTILCRLLPKRLVEQWVDEALSTHTIATLSKQQIEYLSDQFNQFTIKPNATEGYRTAEVTLGGVDCDALSSKTMESNSVSGLYFIGEVVDVTGWLGGYNFQWAWSSAWAAAQAV